MANYTVSEATCSGLVRFVHGEGILVNNSFAEAAMCRPNDLWQTHKTRVHKGKVGCIS